jgi:hypothetical protein
MDSKFDYTSLDIREQNSGWESESLPAGQKNFHLSVLRPKNSLQCSQQVQSVAPANPMDSAPSRPIL